MITQIYSMVSAEEAVASVEAGADHIGALVQDEGMGCPCSVSVETAKAIFDAVGNTAVRILIPESRYEDNIIAYAKATGPDVIHLSGTFKSSAEFRARVERELPGVRIMQAIGVTGPEAVEEAIERQKYADFLLLDTAVPNPTGSIGAIGVTHDWDLDKKIVESVDIPVIIAGGLGPDNVEDAIRYVRPYGVDTLTKTSIKDENGELLCKDIELVRQFCEKAHSVKL